MVHKKPQPNSKGSSYLRLAAQLRGLGARLVVGVLSCTVSLACLVLQAQQEHFRTRSLQVTTPTTAQRLILSSQVRWCKKNRWCIPTYSITGHKVHTEQMVHTKVKPKKRKACLGSASRAVCLVLGSPRQVAGLLLGLPQATLHQNLTRAAVLQAVYIKVNIQQTSSAHT